MNYEIQYFPYFTPSEIPHEEREHPRYRVHLSGDPDLWVMETNWEAPNNVQMEAAWALCEALNSQKPMPNWLRIARLVALMTALGVAISFVMNMVFS